MDGSASPVPTLAIIGGGFSGACVALHLCRAGFAGRIVVFEPRAVLGLGVAYSTLDPAHRINARASRMSLYPDDPEHFMRWIAATGACAGDAAAALPDGRLFPRRAVYGAYVAAQLAPALAAGRITHVRGAVTGLEQAPGGWRLETADGAFYGADMVVLATGHAPAGVPAVVARAAEHEAFVGDPLRPGALAGIAAAARVLIIGTGLTMADTVAALDQNGHAGPITAISRRGQWPRPHAMEDRPCEVDLAPVESARGLVRAVRTAVARAAAEGLPWQAVFDGLRWRAEAFWAALPVAERRRLVRHARPFWDTHRHRLPPPTAAILARRLAAGTLRIRAASVVGARGAGRQIEVALRPRGGDEVISERYDAVVVTAGPGRPDQPPHALGARLVQAGVLTLDATGQGFRVGACAAPLFVVGPPSRGELAEIISVPEIAWQSAALAVSIVASGLVAKRGS